MGEIGMRRITTIVLLAFVLLVSSLALTSATASDRDSFRVTAVSQSLVELDLGATGESVGDQIVFSDDVYYKGKRLVGSLDGSCTTTRVTTTAFHQHCLVTMTLKRGQITAQGTILFDEDFDDEFTLAITGGTGKYDEAAGEAHVEFVSDTKTRIEVELED
jgi:hypothetical protein